MNIIICDDRDSACRQVAEIIKSRFDFNIICCHNQSELINAVHINAPDLLIIDIELGDGINGIDIASEINRDFPKVKIIFLTGYGDTYHERIFFNFSPYGFVTKPIRKNVLLFLVKKLNDELNCGKKPSLKFVSNYVEHEVPIEKIIYIQSIKRKCEIVTSGKTFGVYAKISETEGRLDDSFLRCHQSFIVNLRYIKSMEKNLFILQNGAKIPISDKYFKKSKEAFCNYLGRG